MKNVLIACMVFLCAQTNAQKASLIYDDHAQVRQIGSFKAIKVSSGIDLYLTQAESCAVAVSASDNDIRNRIQTIVEGETLVIKLKNANGWSWSKWGNYKMKAYVSVKELNALLGSGAVNIFLLSKIVTPTLNVKLSGASDFKGEIDAAVLSVNVSGASDFNAQVNASSMILEASGASNIEMNGIVDDISIDLSGASDAKLYDLYAKGAVVKVSGASTANVQVSKLLKAQASGASNINYKGDAIVREMNSSGSSSIKHKD
jgi:uncharacterized protein YaiE (UPF0345 family)